MTPPIGNSDTRAPLQRTVTAVAAGALVLTPGAALAGPQASAPAIAATQADTPPPAPDGTITTPPPGTTPTTAWQDGADATPDASSPAATASGMAPVVSTGAKDPFIASPVNGSTVELGAEVLAGYDCQDDTPPPLGTYSCVGTVPNGTPIDTSTLGVKNFVVDFSHDIVGPLGQSIVSYEVVEPVATPSIAGTVTDETSGDPLPGTFVAVLRTNDFSLAGGAVTDGAGAYSATVPDGSYFLYLIDPTGDHPSGFFGPPTQIDVTEGNTVDADPILEPTRGSIAGSVTEDGSGTPIPGAFAISLSVGGVPGVGVVADGGGNFEIPGLTAGQHRLAAIDPTGGHAPRFSGGTPDVPSSTPVDVSAGAVADGDLALPAQTPNAGGAALTGTVTEEGTGLPLAGMFVFAMRAADFGSAGSTVTDGNGNYSLDLEAGSYQMVFFDPTGTHDMEWHDDRPYFDIGSATPVAVPSVTDAALDPNTGSMTGTITDDPSGTPIAGAWVVAIDPTGGIVGGAATGLDGTYTIVGLPAGSYRATFVDPNGGRSQEYFDDSPDYDGSAPIAITGGAATTVDAALAAP